MFVCVSPAHLAAGVNAKELVDLTVEWTGGAGKGGGRPNLANATIPITSSCTTEVIHQVLQGANNYFSKMA